MKVNGKHTRSIWLEDDGQAVGIIDQTLLPHRFATLRLQSCEDAARAIKSMQTRGAPLIGAVAAYGLAMALRADASDESLERAYAALLVDASDRDQPEMGAGRNRGRGAQPSARGAPRRGLQARGRDLRRGRRDERGHRPARPQADRGDRREEKAGRAGQRAHPLQCRLACDRRLGHRDRADLHGARQGHPDPCLGRRDAAAQPGRLAHRVRARPARRAAHRDPGQYRRSLDAARRGRYRDRRHRPGNRAGRRLQQDRNVFEGAGCEG